MKTCKPNSRDSNRDWMKHNENVYTLLFLLSFTKCQHEKDIERTLFVSADAQKGWESTGSAGTTLPQYVPDLKNLIFTWSVFALLSTDKNGKNDFIKGF